MNDVELNLVAFFQALVSIKLDRAVMNKHVGAIVPAYKAVALCVVEPFHFAFILSHSPAFLRADRAKEHKLLYFTDASRAGLVFHECRVIFRGRLRGTAGAPYFLFLFVAARRRRS